MVVVVVAVVACEIERQCGGCRCGGSGVQDGKALWWVSLWMLWHAKWKSVVEVVVAAVVASKMEKRGVGCRCGGCGMQDGKALMLSLWWLWHA